MGRGHKIHADADGILYGTTMARKTRAELNYLHPQEYWVDKIDYSTFSKFGNNYFQDRLGYCGWTFWGVRSQALPDQLKARLQRDDASPEAERFVDKIIEMSHSAAVEDFGSIRMKKEGSSEWLMSFGGMSDHVRRADPDFMTAIEQISGGGGRWAWKDSEGYRYLLYLDFTDTVPQLLGWRIYAA